jgi:Leucine-rich repeat (LRR) protein
MEDTSLVMYDGTVFDGKESATSKSIYNENETSYENVVLNNDAGVNTSIPTNLYSTSPSFVCPPNQIVHLIQLFDTGGNGWGSTKLEIVETSSAAALHGSEEEGSIIIFVGSLDASNRIVTEYDTYNNEQRRSMYDSTITHSHRILKRPSNTGTILTTTGDKLEYKLISSAHAFAAAGTPTTINDNEKTNHAKRFADTPTDDGISSYADGFVSSHVVVGATNSPTPTIQFPTMTPTIDKDDNENERNINNQISSNNSSQYICLKPDACYTARVSEGLSLEAFGWEITDIQSNTILAKVDGVSAQAPDCSFGLTDSCVSTCAVSELYPTEAPSGITTPEQRPTIYDLRKKKKSSMSSSPTETVVQADTDSASASVNQYVHIRDIIVANSPVSKMALSDKNSIQSQALSWLYTSDIHDMSDHQLVQRWALASFYYATNGNSWVDNERWLTTDDECTWFGITCIDGTVHKLELVQNHLTGTIIPEIATLRNLYVLSLGNDLNSQEEEKNVLIMPLPSFLCDLTSLTFLNLASVGLTSTIPEELFSSWSNMKALFLSDNDITGYIPSSIDQLRSIEVLWLGGNNLGGSIPTEIGQLLSLKDLSLESNFREDVTGKRGLITTIPSEIGQLKNLESLNLADNALSGLVPMNLGGLVSLRRLQLKRNYFEGQLPPSLGRLELLEELDISYNWLSSTIPPEYGGMISLTALSLASNYNDDDGYFTQGIIGTLPTQLGMLTNLQLIDLSNNYITGTLITEIGQLQHLQSFLIQNNFLHGSIPIEYANCVSLKELVLQDMILIIQWVCLMKFADYQK